jgi:hypothetical protein
VTNSRVLLPFRILVALSAAALAWAVAIALTGGADIRLGSLHFTSTNPAKAALAGAVAGALALGMRWRWHVNTTWAEEWSWWADRIGVVARAAMTVARRLLRRPVAVVAIVGAILDIHLWTGQLPLWLDEEMIALNIRDRPFGQLPGGLWLGQSAPLGWLVLQRVVLLTTGPGELALRFVPLLFGLATLGAGWWIGTRWMGRAAGVALMLMLVFGQYVSHYRFELKHYSADTFAGVLLPALAAWVLEAQDRRQWRRRMVTWWATAAATLWFANGAVLAAPACALWLAIDASRRGGRRAVLVFGAAGCIWLAAFGAHYELSLRDTHQNRFLRSVWASQVPPEGTGIVASVRWIVDRLEPLAENPGGSGLPLPLWICAAAGFAFAAPRAAGILFALMPLSAFVLVMLQIVPLYQRFSLWIAPALYVGVALLLDRAVSLGRSAWRRGPRAGVVPAVIAILASAWVCGDVAWRGSGDVLVAAPRNIHGVDDRAAVGWLLAHRQPGDAIMTTHLGWPAVWWYGGISIADERSIGPRQPDGSAMYEMVHTPGAGACSGAPLREQLGGHPRVLVHLGFPDVPEGFSNLLLDVLGEMGAITAFRQFTERSLAAVVELRLKDAGHRELIELERRRPIDARHPGGCVRIEQAQRW